MAATSAGPATLPGLAPAEHPEPLIATVALTVTAALGCMLVLIPVAILIHPSTRLPGVLANLGDQNQTVKTTLYLVAFLVVVPGSLAVVPRVVERLQAGPNGGALGLLAAILAAGLGLAIIVGRVSAVLPWGDGVAVVLVAACCWWALALALILRVISPVPWPALQRARRWTTRATGAAVLSALGALLCLTTIPLLSLAALIAGALLVAGVALLRGGVSLPALSGPSAALLEVIVAVVLFLAVLNLAIFKPAANPFLTHLNALVIEGQENYLLGPANQLLHGGTMLVNTVSQYGVGSIYFLAGWFHLAPIGYGTLGFLDGLLTGLVYVASYLLLRLVGVSRLLACGAIALGVIALVYHLTYPVGALAEHGPLRFGLPLAGILAVAIGRRFPTRARAAGWAILAVVALASIWSLEAFAYTVFTVAAMGAVRVAMLERGTRRSWLLGHAVRAAAVVVGAQLILAAATLAGTGHWPDWPQYFSYFRAFVSGSVAQLTYGFARWSPGLAVGALYMASVIALVLVVWRARSYLHRQASAFIVVAGTTAYGIALFSYFDNRSATYLLLYVALPALLTGVLWLSVLLRLSGDSRPALASGLLAGALSVAVLLVAAAWAPISGRFSDSALGHLLPGGPSLSAALTRLWHPPALDPRTPEGQRLLARYMPNQQRSLLVLPGAADLGVEILIRSQRGSVLPMGDPIEDSIVPSARLVDLRSAIDALRPGQRLLMNRAAQAYLAMLRTHPGFDPLATPNPELVPALDQWVLGELVRRFRLRTVATDRLGFIVAQLERRS